MMRAILSAAFLVSMPIAMSDGQFQNTPVYHLPGAYDTEADEPSGANLNPVEEHRLLNALNADRQRAMVSDTTKLLRLVNELNAEVAGKSPQELSPNQLRKVAEIEKLAHSIREKMSYSVRGTAPYRQPPPIFKR